MNMNRGSSYIDILFSDELWLTICLYKAINVNKHECQYKLWVKIKSVVFTFVCIFVHEFWLMAS